MMNNNFLAIIGVLYMALYTNYIQAQLKGSYVIGGIGDNLKIFTLSYPIILQSSDCFVITSSISRFKDGNIGTFLIDCNSLKKNKKNDEFYVNVNFYPNPASNILTMIFDREIPYLNEFIVYYHNSAGSLIKTSLTTQDELLLGFTDDISNLLQGFYYVTLTSASFSLTFKIIKN
mgnify:CR=1 FL=1